MSNPYYCKTCGKLDELGITGHLDRCKPACNQCVTKEAELARLRNQLAAMQPKPPKRDRATYMREFRKRGNIRPA